MRDDFSKLLTEQPRYQSSQSFKGVRHSKRFQGDEIGGREGIRRRYALTNTKKQFGEFLSPLEGYLKKQVGRKWDAVYSEIRQKFDIRKVTNQHIFQHIFDFIQVKDLFYDEDGVLMLRKHYGTGYEPWSQAPKWYPDVYVDPKDGIIKPTKRVKPVTVKHQATYKKIDAMTDIALIDGNWFILTWQKCSDKPEVKYRMTDGTPVMELPRYTDVFTGETVYHDAPVFNWIRIPKLAVIKDADSKLAAIPRQNFFRAHKRAANKQEIKKYA